jgi:hypothetical protein
LLSFTTTRYQTTERISAFSNASYLLLLHIIIIFILQAAGTGAWSLEPGRGFQSTSKNGFSLDRTLIRRRVTQYGTRTCRLYVSAAPAALYLESESTGNPIYVYEAASDGIIYLDFFHRRGFSKSSRDFLHRRGFLSKVYLYPETFPQERISQVYPRTFPEERILTVCQRLQAASHL